MYRILRSRVFIHFIFNSFAPRNSILAVTASPLLLLLSSPSSSHHLSRQTGEVNREFFSPINITVHRYSYKRVVVSSSVQQVYCGGSWALPSIIHHSSCIRTNRVNFSLRYGKICAWWSPEEPVLKSNIISRMKLNMINQLYNKSKNSTLMRHSQKYEMHQPAENNNNLHLIADDSLS